MIRFAAFRPRSLGTRTAVAAASAAIAIPVILSTTWHPRTDAGPLEPPPPHFETARIAAVLQPIADEIGSGAFPGAAVAFGRGEREVYTFGLGATGWTRNATPVDPGVTRYDLASLTKVVATSAAVMLLVDEGRISLDDPVSDYLPNFAEGPKAEVTIRHLLNHTSGLPAGSVLRGRNRREKIERATRLDIYPPAGARTEYSDIGYILLWEAAAKAAGEPLPRYLERRFFEPLQMHATGFSPGLECDDCAPTGRLRDQSLYRGKPFDPIAQSLDGIAGSAGLFSTAGDLARFAAMVANGGEVNGRRIVSQETLAEFTELTPGADFALGWEARCGGEMGLGGCDGPVWIAHTGWTGTFIAVDPVSNVWLVLLTNRTYEPRAPNRIQQLRQEVFANAVRPTNLQYASIGEP